MTYFEEHGFNPLVTINGYYDMYPTVRVISVKCSILYRAYR